MEGFMPRITVGFGIFLIVVGVVGFVATQSEEGKNVTALIPTAVGLLLLVLGALAQRDIARKHVMHAAALLGLLGVVLPCVPIGMSLSRGEIRSQAALIEQAVMAIACAIFLALCVKSFIDARRSRGQGEQTAPSDNR